MKEKKHHHGMKLLHAIMMFENYFSENLYDDDDHCQVDFRANPGFLEKVLE